MNIPNPACTNCGKNLTTDDLRRTSCAYCGTLLPHHARAAQQVAVVQQMLADRNGNGIPDAFEGLVQTGPPHGSAPSYGHPPMHAHYNAIATQTAQQVQAATNRALRGILVVVVVFFVLALLLAGGLAAFALLARGS